MESADGNEPLDLVDTHYIFRRKTRIWKKINFKNKKGLYDYVLLSYKPFFIFINFLHLLYGLRLLNFTFEFYYSLRNRKESEKQKRRVIKMKKIITSIVIAAMAVASFAGCSSSGDSSASSSSQADASVSASAGSDFDSSKDVTVVSREDGSGTRGAFIELMGIEKKNDAGEKVDYTTEDANITNSTSVMMTTVAGNEYAIGYISLGSLDDSVKALKIDGAEATVDDIKDGTYKVARPFNIVLGKETSDVAQDFINFIMSKEGQSVISENGYIGSDDAAEFASNGATGKIVVAGSSSVTPVMEKLKEAYNAVCPNVEIEVQQSDSTTGVTSTIDGICDIGMASRDLKDSEKEAGVTSQTIAMDGIAVIVNNSNPTEELSSETVSKIYTGDITTWADAQ